MSGALEAALTGSCLCGGVRFEVVGPVRMLAGEELVPSWRPERGFAREFCGECGAHLWSRDPESGEIFSVRLGAFDGDPGVRPSFRQFVDSAAPWEPVPEDGLERAVGSEWSSAATGTM